MQECPHAGGKLEQGSTSDDKRAIVEGREMSSLTLVEA